MARACQAAQTVRHRRSYQHRHPLPPFAPAPGPLAAKAASNALALLHAQQLSQGGTSGQPRSARRRCSCGEALRVRGGKGQPCKREEVV
jgi:hypothetical protein